MNDISDEYMGYFRRAIRKVLGRISGHDGARAVCDRSVRFHTRSVRLVVLNAILLCMTLLDL